MEIKTWRDPYDAGFSPTSPSKIEIQEGLTVLVGCNGAGKTTLLQNIESELKKNGIPVHLWNNLNDGGRSVISGIFGGYGEDGDDISVGMDLLMSSEGESIKINICRQSRLYKEFLSSGYYKNRSHKTRMAFSDYPESKITTKQRWLLFDATDSGLSIDSICEIRSLFNALLSDAKSFGVELYIVISANEYELCRGTDCFDVNAGKYIRFSDYEDYRTFIIKSRKKKEKRIEKQIAWKEKQKEKESRTYESLVRKNKNKILAIQNAAKEKNRTLTWIEKNKIDNLEREIKDFRRNSRFLR